MNGLTSLSWLITGKPLKHSNDHDSVRKVQVNRNPYMRAAVAVPAAVLRRCMLPTRPWRLSCTLMRKQCEAQSLHSRIRSGLASSVAHLQRHPSLIGQSTCDQTGLRLGVVSLQRHSDIESYQP
eukprot:scaffold6399_cov215-Prasinococcus_capsulatus_cf.AAC.1